MVIVSLQFLYYNRYVGRRPFGLRLKLYGKGKRFMKVMNRRKAGFLLLLAWTCIFTACGGEDTVHTTAQVSETETDIAESGETSEINDEEPGAGETNDEDTDNEEAESSDDEEKTVKAAARGSFMAPVEMDEDLKNQLAEEMLQENEMDTSVVESAPVTKGCSFTLPEAFSESEDIEGMYVTRRYPIDASTIYYVALGRDVALQLMTEETFKAQAEENFRKEYGEDIEVHIDSFERIRIDGCPAFRIRCHYQVGDTQMSQLEYAINADKSYVITYSQTDDYDRMEEYEASAETIHLDF